MLKSNVTIASRYIATRALGNLYFWGSISIPYLVYRGFSITGAFTLLSFYSLLVVILEFPTGILGDLIGHKKTIVLADFTGALAMLLLALKLPLPAYYFVFILSALAASLVSGSDDAYLRSISSNFRRDLTKVRKYGTIFAFTAFVSAGFLAKIHFSLPLLITALAWTISGIIIARLPESNKTQITASGNIFHQAFSSLKYVWYSVPLIAVMLYGSLNEGYQFSIKTLINSATPSLGVDIRYIGLIVGLGVISRTIAYQISARLDFIKTRYLFATSIALFTALTLITPGILSLVLIAISNFSVSLVNLRTDLAIHDLVGDTIRASVISFKNLFVRLFSASYLFLAGFLIEHRLLQLLMFITLVGYAITGYISLKLSRRYDSPKK